MKFPCGYHYYFPLKCPSVILWNVAYALEGFSHLLLRIYGWKTIFSVFVINIHMQYSTDGKKTVFSLWCSVQINMMSNKTSVAPLHPAGVSPWQHHQDVCVWRERQRAWCQADILYNWVNTQHISLPHTPGWEQSLTTPRVISCTAQFAALTVLSTVT